MVRAGDISVLQPADKTPEGCVTGFVTDDISAIIKVVGLVDFKAELKRLEKSKAKIETFRLKLEQKTKSKFYLTKVPEKVRDGDKARLNGYETELAAV